MDAAGRTIWLRSVARSRSEPDGSVVWDGSIYNVTDRKQAEREQAKLAAIVETSIISIVGLAPNGTITSWNAGAEQVYGYPADEAIGRPIGILRPPERVDEMDDVFDRLRRGERIDHFETVRMRKSGERIDASLSISPVRDGEGRVVAISAISRDITERSAPRRNSGCCSTSSTTGSRTRLPSCSRLRRRRSTAPDSSADFRTAFLGRVRALAEAHSLLTQANWAAADLYAVVELAIRPYRRLGEGVAIDGPKVRLNPKPALTMTLAMHELATNAAKYGALSNNGTVSVSWRIVDGVAGPRVELTWLERGGPPVEPPSHRGFGSELIERGVAYELDGTAQLSYEAEGLLCRVCFPLTHDIGQRAG